MKTSFGLSLLLLGAANRCATLMAQSPGTFTPTGSMITPRWGHTATLLLNGKVLIAGGLGANSLPVSAEIYDPETGTFSSTGHFTVNLVGSAATLLPNGQVLFVGLDYTNAAPPRLEAQIYDPLTGTFSPAGSIELGNVSCVSATLLLTTGRVLITVGTLWPPAGVQGVPPYLYDRTSATFAATGQYVTTVNLDEDVCPTEVLLADGKVLTTWESWKAEVYNPATGTFLPTGDLIPTGSEGYTARLLTNGNVLIAGGDTDPINSLYDPTAGKFTTTVDMKAMRPRHTATLLPDGTVLIAGGYYSGSTTRPTVYSDLPTRAELYHPDTGTFTETGDMIAARFAPTATLLGDGTVLIAGGRGANNSTVVSAEIYHPIVNKAAPVLLTDAAGEPAILHASTQQIVSLNMPATAGEALEIYMTGLIDNSVIPPQVFVGGRMAEVLFAGNAPGFPGLNQVNVRVPEGIVAGPAVTVRLMYLGRPSNEVAIPVQ